MNFLQTLLSALILMGTFLTAPSLAFAQTSPTYWTSEVLRVVEQREIPPLEGEDLSESRLYTQQLEVRNPATDELVTVSHGSEFQPLSEAQLLTRGDSLVLVDSGTAVSPQSPEGSEAQPQVQIADRYRLPTLTWILGGFFVLVLAVSGWRGGLSIVGMGISLVVLALYVVPQILSGANPLTVSMIGAFVIAALTVYLSHGFSVKSHLAFVSMMVTLLAVALLANTAVELAQLTGFGSEEAGFLAYGATSSINLQGLLLGGILLGALGVLDDICVSQISTVIELRRANTKWKLHELYAAGMRVGRDHVASLVNTLVLAYAGANLPLFILFSLAQDTPAWVHLNSELLAEEIVRTLVGSIGLVLAVPLTTLLVSIWAERTKSLPSDSGHSHSHAH
jgi:uncharacterized membrane protein